MSRRIVIIAIAVLVAGGISAARPAVAAADNAAIAVNTKDGTTVFKVAFAIRHVMSDVVTETNAAVAYNSCTDCASVAIAFEIVLVESDASVISPTNIAIAFNENCTTCVAVAEAYQFVLGTGGLVHFDAEGNRVLSEIRRQLHALRKEDLTIDQLQAILDDMSTRIADVLANHLVSVGPSSPQETTSTATTSTTTPTATTTPTTTEETTTTTTTTPTTTTEATTTSTP
ncbi:MAG: putative peptide zinc metalloprotease protein [Actinomycetota bacterium]|jgi:putative peptide zinc metalloprotease protein